LAKTKKITYPHFTVEEKEKKKPKTTLVHRHLARMRGTRSYESTDGKVLTVKDSAKMETETSIADKDFLSEKCDITEISPYLYCAVWKNNPDKGFYYITGNKKSAPFDHSNLKHAPNRILKVLRYSKKRKKAILSIATEKSEVLH
jgi:hypothetical protein